MEGNNVIIIQGEEDKAKQVHYEIDPSREPIGKGGTGVVRIGQMVDERTGMRRDVAIKFLYDDMPANILVRSQREASIRVQSENLVEMIGFVQTTEYDAQGRTIIHSHVVSELLHGVMLLDVLKGISADKDGNEVPMANEYCKMMLADRNQFALKIVRNVLSGIQALHDSGYIHRDIDPSNIMITDKGKVKLIDLGIAKKIDSMSRPDEQHLTSAGQFIGKAAYAAPELVLGDLSHQNETTDVYAIGVMLYLLVVGKLPFNGSIQEILHQQCTEKMPVQNIKDKNIRKIVKKATEKKQSERFQSASEFRVALDNVVRTMKFNTIVPQTASVNNISQDANAGATVVGDSGTVVGSLETAGTVVGNPNVSGTVVGNSENIVSSQSFATQTSSKNRKPLYIGIALAIVAVVAVVCFFIFNKETSESVENDGLEQTVQNDNSSSADASSDVATSTSSQQEESESASDNEQQPEETKEPAMQPEEGKSTQTPSVAKQTPKQTTSAPSSAKPEKTEKSVKQEKPAAKSGNGMKLSYGTYTGPVKNGYPNGKGKLVYSTTRRINKYDSKGIVAKPGEYVEGLFVNGFLTVGKHYSASGELLNKISAGVAEGVYESK